jgi:hypothetical protein
MNEIVGIILGSVVTLITLFIKEWFERKREKRNNKFKKIDEAIELIAKIYNQVTTWNTNDMLVDIEKLRNIVYRDIKDIIKNEEFEELYKATMKAMMDIAIAKTENKTILETNIMQEYSATYKNLRDKLIKASK